MHRGSVVLVLAETGAPTHHPCANDSHTCRATDPPAEIGRSDSGCSGTVVALGIVGGLALIGGGIYIYRCVRRSQNTNTPPPPPRPTSRRWSIAARSIGSCRPRDSKRSRPSCRRDPSAVHVPCRDARDGRGPVGAGCDTAHPHMVVHTRPSHCITPRGSLREEYAINATALPKEVGGPR